MPGFDDLFSDREDPDRSAVDPDNSTEGSTGPDSGDTESGEPAVGGVTDPGSIAGTVERSALPASSPPAAAASETSESNAGSPAGHGVAGPGSTAGGGGATAPGFESAFDGEPFDDANEVGIAAGGGVAGTGGAPDRVRVRKRRRKERTGWRTTLIVLLVTVSFLGIAAVAGTYLLLRHYNNNVTRVQNVFTTHLPGVPTPVVRPPKVVSQATNMLLVGSDSRAGQQTTGTGGDSGASSPIGQRSDTMMLVHVDAAKNAAWVISIPRDSWVPIPGHGTNKINAAFSFGGPALMVATVEQLTHVHIDHYAEIDFEGFRAMTDALGGVDVKVSHSFKAFGVTFTQGVMHMNGDTALAFVRDRHNQPGSDFGRINDQHTFLLALMQKASGLSLLSNPLKINSLLDAITQNVSVDDTFTASKLYAFVFSMRSIKPSDVQFMTLPYRGTGMVGDQSVVFLNPTLDAPLYDSLVHDTMNTYTPTS